MSLRVTLLVTGSIAAYKSAELIRELQRRGAEVRVAMSESAQEFITPLTLQTLSGFAVQTDFFDEQQESEIGHIALADEAEVVLVAPATAACIAKAALGIADDLPGAVLLATRAAVVFAPAMNVNMWEHPATQQHIATLQARGARIVEPDEGELACGWVGKGRLAELSSIGDAVEEVASLAASGPLADTRVVVSAGPTREAIDPVRFVSNRSSGKMGYSIAAYARSLGAQVELIAGPCSLPAPAGVKLHQVETALQMRDAMLRVIAEPGVSRQMIFMAAAVSDHRPASLAADKLKHSKDHSYSLEFAANPDILHELGSQRSALEKQSKSELFITGFCVETTDNEAQLREAMREKLKKKKTDMIVGNSAQALGAEQSQVYLLDASGTEGSLQKSAKQIIAKGIVDYAMTQFLAPRKDNRLRAVPE